MNRRMMMQLLNTNEGTKATDWYTIGEKPDEYADYKYWFKINLNGSDYNYCSNYPFYFYIIDSGYYICYPKDDSTIRNGSVYNPYGTTELTEKNNVVYYKEVYSRTNSVVSNCDIYVWEE